MKKAISLLIVLSMVLMSLSGITLVGSAEETGTITIGETVYETISTAAEFSEKISENPSGDFALIADITLDQTAEVGTVNYYSLITSTFSGALIGVDADGEEEVRTINVKSASGVGLFAAVSGATIKNIKTTGEITGYVSNAGGFVGTASANSKFESCENAATINITAVSGENINVGGIVGTHSTGALTLNNCKNTVAITIDGGNNVRIGGIVGINNISGKLTLNKCSNTGELSGKYGGGLVGSLKTGEINGCFNIASVTMSTVAGGLVGSSNGANSKTISNSYNTGEVKGGTGGASTNFAGGIIGNTASTSVLNCYNIGAITRGTTSGQICAKTDSPANVKNCYYLAEADGERVNGVQALSPISMLNLADYSETVVNEDETTTTYSFDSNIWGINGTYPYIQLIGNFQPIEATAIETPVLDTVEETDEGYVISWNAISDATLSKYEITVTDSEDNTTEYETEENEYTLELLEDKIYTVSIVAVSEYDGGNSEALTFEINTYYAGGKGTEADPYIIKTARHFKNISVNPAAYYNLAADITLDQTLSEGAYIPVESFSGSLVGINANGEEDVRTVTIAVNASGDVTGMFKTISGATIKNIKTTGSMTTSDSGSSGAFAASGTGAFYNCENNVNMTISRNGSSYAGGFVGQSANSITFENCKNTGDIIASGNVGTYCIGGLIGKTTGGTLTITNCLNSASISGGSKTGGLVGSATEFNMTAGANTGAVSGYGEVGGLVGTAASTKKYSIIKSYNTGSIHCTNSRSNLTATYVGGLIGNVPTTVTTEVTDSYNAGELTYTSKQTHTTIVSKLFTAGTSGSVNVTNCYSAIYTDDAFVANTSENVTLTGCYYLSTSEGETVDGLKALTSTQMKKQTEGTTLNDNFEGFDFANVWTYDEDGVYPYPQLIGNIQEVVIKAIATPSLSEAVTSDANDVYTIKWNAISDLALERFELKVADLEGEEIYNENLDSDVTSYDLSKGLTMGKTYNVSLIAKSRFDGGDSKALEFTFDTTYAGGAGTEQSPYLIANERQFNNIALKATAKTVYFKLMEDITLGDKANGESFVPFEFCGVFLGNKKTITLYINETNKTNTGLFTGVLTGSRIENLTVDGEITSTVDKSNIGGITATLQASVIDNCVNNAKIQAAEQGSVGGIFGALVTGGNSSVINCVNNADINADGYTAGIGAMLNAGAPTVNNCINNGKITGNYAGGIVAHQNSKELSDCVNNGIVNGYSWAGGIIAYKIGAERTLEIKNCKNTGMVIAKDPADGYVGGIVGRSQGTLSITGCTNLGPVFRIGEYVNNPIIASTYDVTVTDCSYLAYDLSYDDGIETTTLKTAEQFTNSELDKFVLVEIVENENGSIYYEGKKFYIKNGTELRLIAKADDTDYSKVSADCGNNPVSIEGSTITLTVAYACVVTVTFSIPDFEIADILVYGDDENETIDFNELIYFENKFTSAARASQYGAMLFTKFGGVSRSDKEEFGFVYSKDNQLSETDVLLPVSKSTAGVYFYGNNTEETNYVGGYLKLIDGTYIFSEDVYEFRLTTLNKGE